MTKRRRNRVTPYGELIAVPERGMFWGNRGVLVDDHGQLARYSRGRAWMICVLEYKGIRRQQWTPRRLTELYFLDEATDRRLHADRLLAPSVRRTYRAGAHTGRAHRNQPAKST
jgi:hypothetical protein